MSSQPGTSEVSKKLKAAIRAKLEELGVYVDDELPDYIMVMIANKKEKAQMKEDLNLFIGKSTGKFVDWLFDLFDRLQNASTKPGEASRKEEDKSKELEAKEQEEKRRKEEEQREKELQKQKDREREKEKEREKQREREREKRLQEEKRRDEKRKEIQKNKRRRSRSRSNTYSDEEEKIRPRQTSDRHHNREKRERSSDRKRITSSVARVTSGSPDRKLQSTVTVKRNIRPTGDNANVKARGSMFLRAMNEASASANHESSKRDANNEEQEDDEMSDVEALPSKSAKSPRKSIRERLSRITKEPSSSIDDDAVVLNNQIQSGGPQMILKLAGGKEAIKKTRIQDRIVVDDNLRRGTLKRKMEVANDEPKSKHERIIFDISPSGDSTPPVDSPTMQKWNGQISLGDDSDSDDEEAEIDALVAEARGIARRDSVREEEDELPPTHQLSGGSFAIHVGQGYQQVVPTYIPTPLSVLQEQQNQQSSGGPKEDISRERCVFWPKCTKGDECAFIHPTKNCTNFPNCSYGIRCLFIHPACRFDRFCTKKHCPFTHYGTGGTQTSAPEFKNPLTSNRIPSTAATSTLPELPKPVSRGALGSLAAKLAASINQKKAALAEKKGKEKADENEKKTEDQIVPSEPSEGKEEEKGILDIPTEETSTKSSTRNLPEIAPLQNMIPCRYAGGCRNPVCHFKHPKECRFGTNCRNPSCYFYHKPGSSVAQPTPAIAETGTAKYKWTATTAI